MPRKGKRGRRVKAKTTPRAKEGTVLDKVAALITAITHEEEVAKAVGTTTGINLTTLAANTIRMLKGEMTEKEVFAYFSNIAGVYFGAKKAYEVWSNILKELEKIKVPTLEEVGSIIMSKLEEAGFPFFQPAKKEEEKRKIKIKIMDDLDKEGG